jgi:hypothetical protein
MAAAQGALAERNFHKAQNALEEVRARADRQPGLLSKEDQRRLVQLQRQSELLALLLNDSLQEIVRLASLHRDVEEWQAKFATDYRGHSVIFEDEVSREDGRPVLLHYRVQVGNETARVALEDLTLLRDLPLDEPKRLLFGARLASVARETGGLWVIRFEPDSGVLLTDKDAVAACLPFFSKEEQSSSSGQALLDVLRTQQEWVLPR